MSTTTSASSSSAARESCSGIYEMTSSLASVVGKALMVGPLSFWGLNVPRAIPRTDGPRGSTEADALENFGADAATTVMSGSHHGARTHGSNSAAWVEGTSPAVAVFSAGRSFRHPQCSVVDRFLDVVVDATSHPMQCGDTKRYRPVRTTRKAVYMTEVNGAVVITSSGKSPMSLFCTRSVGCDVSIAHR